jgi:PAS domain S-box-containing protein
MPSGIVSNSPRRAGLGAPPAWLLAVVGLALAGLLTGGFWFLRDQELHLKRGAEDEILSIANLKVDQLVQWRNERLGDAAVLARNPFFREGLQGWLDHPSQNEAESLLRWFRSLQVHYNYSDVLLVDSLGQVRLSLSGRRGGLHAEVSEALATAMHSGGARLSDLHVGPGGLPPHLDAVAPILAEGTREPLGGLVLRSDARQFLYPMLQAWPVPSRTAETLLVRRDGRETLFLSELRHQAGTALELRIPLSRAEVPAVMAALGKEGLVRGLDYRGVPVIAALRGIPGSSWHIVAKMDLAEVYANWRRSASIVVALFVGLAAAAVASAGALWLRRSRSHYQALYQAEAARRSSEERFRTSLENMMEGCQIIGPDWRYLYLNRVAAEQARRPREQLLGRTMQECYPGIENTPLFATLRRCLQERREEFLENQFFYPDGASAWFQLAIQPVPEGLFILGIDISAHKRSEQERERLQAQLAQAQKLESVGRLAGGVAHDFNNMLTVIMGFTEHALSRMQPTDPLRSDLAQIQAAARRSATVVNKLLAFSRRQTIVPRVLNLNDCLAGMEPLLRRLLGEDIDLRVRLAPGLWTVSLDPSQLEQAVANLAVNSRDAMPDGGKLTIESANVSFDQQYCERHPGFLAGDYVLLAVSDNGCGMEAVTLAQACEPFFTTKPEGQGTGLGLSMVYGIVRQNGGFLNLYSEPGQGTTAKLYFRRRLGEPAAAVREQAPAAPAGGRETILLVEDELQVRELTALFLKPLGYTVLRAGSPEEALALCASHTGDVHLLLTDVVLPGMNGKQLQARISQRKPGIKVLFMSGYTADAIAQRGVLDNGIQFLPKPFSLEQLAGKVREVLDRG